MNPATINATAEQQAARDIERCKRIIIKLEDKRLTKERRQSFIDEYKRRKASLQVFVDGAKELPDF